jgi:hypothetical protein
VPGHTRAMDGHLTLRIAEPADSASLVRLAELDSRRLAPGPHLIAERDGNIDAAISLSNGELAADPFKRTAELCELLQSRARQLLAGGGDPREKLGVVHPWPRLVAQ